MSVSEIARSDNSCRVEATDQRLVSQIWFKTEPLNRAFIHGVMQLQLQTDSSDQGPETATMVSGSWSWFELIILKDEKATEPHVKDGKPLVWRSHGNRTDPLDQKDSIDRHFGIVFDRRQGLLDALEEGNVVAVRVCAKYAGWANDAREGHLFAKVLDEGVFTAMSWTLSSKEASNDLPKSIENGVYTLTPDTSCHVKATGVQQVNYIWFTTPVLTAEVVDKIEDLQLFTSANLVGNPTQDVTGSWCWFDIVILENAHATQAKIQDGRSLVWRSHKIPVYATKPEEQGGKLFGPDHEIFGYLAAGNVIAVRVCARFDGWEMEGHSARMVVRISSQGVHKVAPKHDVDWKAVQESRRLVREQYAEYLAEITGDSFAPIAAEDSLVDREIRADSSNGAGGKPLRLLALDGGGVRGISSLHILKKVMAKVAGDPAAKPCDYFDMMAGTSTGGLIAVMLGRLKLSVDECIKQFERLSSRIFHSNALEKGWKLLTNGARYSKTNLEQAIKDVIKQHVPSRNPDERMVDPKGSNCKVFVCAIRGDKLDDLATLFRTYNNPYEDKTFSDVAIWEAARATSAAPTYFKRMEIKGVEFVDGGLRQNNPIFMLKFEAESYFGAARPIGCVISIGTGLPPKISLPAAQAGIGLIGTALTMIKLVTDSQLAHLSAEKSIKPKENYYRFNATTPNEIDLADYERMPDIVKDAERYIIAEEKRIGESARKIPPKHPLYLETSV